MKQKPRKSTNGFHPSAGNQTDPEEMCGDGARDGTETDSADTVSRLSQLLASFSCDNPKLFTTGDTLSQLRDEISSEHRHLTSLYTSIDNVTIYRVAHWSREKIEAELAQYKVRWYALHCEIIQINYFKLVQCAVKPLTKIHIHDHCLTKPTVWFLAASN